jgi:hypothetical protein
MLASMWITPSHRCRYPLDAFDELLGVDVWNDVAGMKVDMRLL